MVLGMCHRRDQDPLDREGFTEDPGPLPVWERPETSAGRESRSLREEKGVRSYLGNHSTGGPGNMRKRHRIRLGPSTQSLR